MRSISSDASLVLIGSPGAGKRSLGFIIANHLGRRLIIEDQYFMKISGATRAQFYQKHGEKDFLKQSEEVMRRMLRDNTHDCVISCGLGSLAEHAQALLQEYAKTHPVIYIVRNSDAIRSHLKLGLEDALALAQVDMKHRFCSNFEFYNLGDRSGESKPNNLARHSPSFSQPSRLSHVKQDILRFIDLILDHVRRATYESHFSINAYPAESRLYTYAISLPLSEMLREGFVLGNLECGGDAVEFILDSKLEHPQILKIISEQVALIRRVMDLPIIYHVARSSLSHNIRAEELYFGFLHHGLRLGVEYLIVDIDCRNDLVQHLMALRRTTKVIGQSLNRSIKWDDDSWVKLYHQSVNRGFDLVRLVQVATSETDNDDLFRFQQKMSPHMSITMIAYNTGVYGRRSVWSNRVLSTVTHPDLKRTPQTRSDLITSAEAIHSLYEASILDPMHFYICGDDVGQSLSPAMHNAAYRVCGLRHDYQIRVMSTMEELRGLIQDPHFGGASLRHPFNVEVIPSLHSQSEHARAIGAVNTLLPIRYLLEDESATLTYQARRRSKAGPTLGLYGDNTDWIGIFNCIRRNTSPRNSLQPSKTTGLVIGAEGFSRAAIYAMKQLGCRMVFVYDRNLEDSERLADHFDAKSTTSGFRIIVLKSSYQPWPEGYDLPTMIVSCLPHYGAAKYVADLNISLDWFRSPTGGVFLEHTYSSLDSPLIRHFRAIKEPVWIIVDGLENLAEQGIEQFELMTGRRAPRKSMCLEVLRNFKGAESQYVRDYVQARLSAIEGEPAK